MTVSPLRRNVRAVGAHHAGCSHVARCPAAYAVDHAIASVVTRYPEQGWSLLCNGVVVFDDGGEILPDGTCIAPQRPDSYPALRAA